jgi:RND family efflux transporter MFP subunit
MQISGMLAVQHVDRGDTVNEGDVLFEIDSEAFQLRVKERTANLTRATAQLHFMGKAQKRKESLHKAGTLSETAWDRHQFDFALARAERDQARVALDQAERNLRLTTLRSAISGIVLERYHVPGEVIPEGTVLAWIVDSTEIIFEVGVSDIELRHLRLKDKVEVTVDAFPAKSFKGHVVRISGNANPKTGTFPVEVRVPNRKLEILPGMIGRLKLLGETYRNQIVIPLMSVHQLLEGQVVYVVEENRLLKKPVRLGKVLGDRVVIQEGIDPGSTVIIMSQRRLEEGNPVEIIK